VAHSRQRKNFNAAQKARIDASIARVARRRLRWAWRTMDPTLPGSTIELEYRDLQSVSEWLRSVAGVDPEALTARALDRCLWAAALFLARRPAEETALKSVRAKECQDRVEGRGAMASEDFARKFSLSPPPRGKQFRAEFAEARAVQRRAARQLETALAARAGATAGADAEAAGPRVNPLALMRAWSSPGMLNLRRDLDPQAEETLHARLEALMAGQLSQRAWVKTLLVILEARRAADRLEQTRPRNGDRPSARRRDGDPRGGRGSSAFAAQDGRRL
jgi:hypothetical protein